MKRAEVVATRRKLAHSLKKFIATATTSPKISSTNPTSAGVVATKATTTSIIPRKVASTMPSSMDTTTMPIVADKWFHPLTKVTDHIAQPSIQLKKKAKKGDCEILVISSQDTRATTPEATHHPYVAKVPMRMLSDSSTSTIDQTTTI